MPTLLDFMLATIPDGRVVRSIFIESEMVEVRWGPDGLR